MWFRFLELGFTLSFGNNDSNKPSLLKTPSFSMIHLRSLISATRKKMTSLLSFGYCLIILYFHFSISSSHLPSMEHLTRTHSLDQLITSTLARGLLNDNWNYSSGILGYHGQERLARIVHRDSAYATRPSSTQRGRQSECSCTRNSVQGSTFEWTADAAGTGTWYIALLRKVRFIYCCSKINSDTERRQQ